jgi:FkbM family methyltransferase
LSLRQRLVDQFVQSAIHVCPGVRFERLGSDYGGWTVPISLITREWICYCGGVGEDITFDLQLIRRTGCRVIAFDPTPRAAAHVAAVASEESRFRFLAIGLWSNDAELRFFAPRDQRHVSHSIVNLQGTSDYFVARCRPISALMRELGHSRIDLLKLDIEGAQHEVLRSMLRDNIRPLVVCVEFDQPDALIRMYRTYRRLKNASYRLVVRDGWNFTFLRNQ